MNFYCISKLGLRTNSIYSLGHLRFACSSFLQGAIGDKWILKRTEGPKDGSVISSRLDRGFIFPMWSNSQSFREERPHLIGANLYPGSVFHGRRISNICSSIVDCAVNEVESSPQCLNQSASFYCARYEDGNKQQETGHIHHGSGNDYSSQSEAAKRIAYTLKQIKLGYEDQNALYYAEAYFTSSFVCEVLAHLDDFHLALDFIAWAELEKGCNPDASTCRVLIDISGSVEDTLRRWLHDWRIKGHKLPASALLDLLSCYCKDKNLPAALAVYSLLRSYGLSLNTLSCNLLIVCSLQVDNHEIALSVYEYMVQTVSSQPNPYTFRSLVQGLTKAGKIDLAYVYLREMMKRGLIPNVTTWNCIIIGFLKMGKIDAAFHGLDEMKSAGCRPDAITYKALVKYLCKVKQTGQAYHIFREMVSTGNKPNVVTYNLLLDGLGKEGQIEKALNLFKEMESCCCLPDVVAYSTLINILGKAGQVDEAYKLLEDMKKQGCMVDCITYNTLIDGFGKAGKMQRVWELFETMKADGCSPNVVTFTTMIDIFLRAGQTIQAETLYEEMKESGCAANAVTYRVLVDGFSRLADISKAWKIFEEMKAMGFSPIVSTYNILVGALGKEGEVEKACQLFEDTERVGFSPKLDLYKTFLLALHESSFEDRILDFLQMRKAQMKMDELGMLKGLVDHFLNSGQGDIALRLFDKLRESGFDMEAVTDRSLLTSLAKVLKANKVLNTQA
ncbi:hypothetical protein O6H91_15G064300 [Diphasiastrum complanatum]|uniref:Uncharacterized protein n=3 Tax=Diphasiastrum complanatum TaxID=34168 RepID=A0ACC2BJ65_DIPCM|nr:hypothetical protein O6H91_20G025700 [Diphasiastrum complanatum]KAJ7529759.1 hypothetical protein O6H91_15G064300 [Diphasiastrum complanatum]KAJ7529760.1 hypothetical protein O6H91_15G064300 [Diphasiastrum complanatum]